jgi:hypothetical protein
MEEQSRAFEERIQTQTPDACSRLGRTQQLYEKYGGGATLEDRID